MQYQITIPQIHCSGCVNLIKITFEDYFENINVDEQNKIASFRTDKDIEEVKITLNKIFQAELEPAGYKYSDLKQINS